MSRFDVSLSRRSFAKGSLAATIGLTTGAPALQSALAQDAATPIGEGTPVDSGMGLPPLPDGATLVAEGLFNPRSLAFGDDGTLYITENGVGGDEVLAAPGNGMNEETSTPSATPVATPMEEEQGPPSTRGYTGRISKVLPDGTQSVIVDGLASYSDGAGPGGLTLGPGVAYFTIGGVAVGMGMQPLPEENTVNSVDVATGEVTQIASLGPYEEENNPDGTDVNPNLYMMATGPDGNLLVPDAGGNTIYSVNPDTGEFSLLGIVPDATELGGGVPNEAAGSGQPVPTSVAVGDDGTIYVSLLREMWPPELPSILTMSADGTFTPFEIQGGLNWTVSLTLGPDGALYASQLFGEFTEQGPGPGRVVRITPDGAIEPVVEGVMMPHGVAFDAEGNFYVAINTLMSGPGMPAGQVIRIDGVAAM